MFLTIFSALDNDIKNITASNGATVNISAADIINTIYIAACNGWINAFTVYSLNQVSNIFDFPPPFPAIDVLVEYVIVINGEIIIKNPIDIILFKYIKKNFI